MIVAAFTHLNPLGSRFGDGSWGVYCAGESLDTAVAEVGHHRAAFPARTAEPAIDIDLRWIQADVLGDLHALHALHGRRADLPEVYDPTFHGAGQTLATMLRDQASAGIVYERVRRPAGQRMAVSSGQMRRRTPGRSEAVAAAADAVADRPSSAARPAKADRRQIGVASFGSVHAPSNRRSAIRGSDPLQTDP